MSSALSEAMSGPWSVRVGRRWFEWRSVSPLPLFLLLVLLPAQATLEMVTAVIALAVVVLAEGLRIWAVGCAGSATRTRGDTIPELVVAGPFRFVRNPLYIANIAMYTATAVLFGFNTLAVVVFVYSAIQYHFIVAFEEDRLRNTFGPSYAKYLERVPRWIPKLGSPAPSTQHAFSLNRALKSERSTFHAMGAMAILYALKQAL